MFFKPTYCCHCGEKIERIEWLPWTSRRFCDVCDKEFSFQEWLPKMLFLLFGLFGLFGAGTYLKSGETVKVVTLKQNTALDNTDKTSAAAKPEPNFNRPDVLQNEQSGQPKKAADTDKSVIETRKTEFAPTENERVYFCGAETKKGAPCSRKVRGGGRCWQHKGQEAMLEQEKLLIAR